MLACASSAGKACRGRKHRLGLTAQGPWPRPLLDLVAFCPGYHNARPCVLTFLRKPASSPPAGAPRHVDRGPARRQMAKSSWSYPRATSLSSRPGGNAERAGTARLGHGTRALNYGERVVHNEIL